MFSSFGIRVGDKTVARLLRKSGYSLQAPSKTVEGKQHPDRNAQFEHINAQAMDCLKRGIPFISVDTEDAARTIRKAATLDGEARLKDVLDRQRTIVHELRRRAKAHAMSLRRVVEPTPGAER